MTNYELWRLGRDDPGYPGELECCLGDEAPATVWGLGNPGILQTGGVALFSSRRCPGAAASRMVDLAQQIRDAARTALGGFHSPMEKECLRILLRSPYPVVVGLARPLIEARLPREWGRALAEGRLLVLSVAGASTRRTTAASALDRNLVLAALASRVLVAHAQPGGATERFCRQLRDWGKPVFRPDVGESPSLDRLGARPTTPGWLHDA